MEDFYGTGIEIRARFGPIGKTEKRVWADYVQLLRVVVSYGSGARKMLIFFKKALQCPH